MNNVKWTDTDPRFIEVRLYVTVEVDESKLPQNLPP